MITYLYYRLCEYFKNEQTDLNWQKGRALLVTSGLLVTNVLSILFVVNSLFFKGSDLLHTILSGNHLVDKFIIIPILISPIFIFVYYVGRKRLETNIDIYQNEPINIKKKKGRFVILYIILSFFILFASSLFVT